MFCVLTGLLLLASAGVAAGSLTLPIPLEAYKESADLGLPDVLRDRVEHAPFNLVASVIFFLAICHTFLTARFRHWAHLAEERHARRMKHEVTSRTDTDEDGLPDEVSFTGQILHFFGEVEAVFGIWALVLAGAIACYFDWQAVVDYIGHTVNFTEPMFVVVIMAIAGTRPVLRVAEACLRLWHRWGRAASERGGLPS